MSLHYLVKHEWPKNQRFVGFSVIHVSQGSVATYVRCGGMSTQCCIANFLLSLSVKEFLKSVKIWLIYCQSLGAWFFGTRCIIYHVTQCINSIERTTNKEEAISSVAKNHKYKRINGCGHSQFAGRINSDACACLNVTANIVSSDMLASGCRRQHCLP